MENFNKKIQQQFEKMCATGKLFRSSVTGQEVWNTYLSGFKSLGVFRDPNSNEYNCNHCNNFIRRGTRANAERNAMTRAAADERGGEWRPDRRDGRTRAGGKRRSRIMKSREPHTLR